MGALANWRYVTSEHDASPVSLETMLRGVAEPTRILDLVENFIVYQEKTHGVLKLLVKSDQYLGVNSTIARLDGMTAGDAERLGVFWHTQGSGKTVSMMFLSQKNDAFGSEFQTILENAAIDDAWSRKTLTRSSRMPLTRSGP